MPGADSSDDLGDLENDLEDEESEDDEEGSQEDALHAFEKKSRSLDKARCPPGRLQGMSAGA